MQLQNIALKKKIEQPLLRGQLNTMLFHLSFWPLADWGYMINGNKIYCGDNVKGAPPDAPTLIHEWLH